MSFPETLHHGTVVGRILRLPLRLIPHGMSVRVLRGPLRGARWVVGAGTHGCWLGTYEQKKQRAFARAARGSAVTMDIGANVGFYTLLAAICGGVRCKVFSFEPLPRNLSLLREHLRLNGLSSVSVFALAVSDRSGTAHFDEGDGPFTGRLSPQGTHSVQTTSLDELSDAGVLPDPDLMKIDVEGAEYLVLQGARGLLRRARPTVFVSTHSQVLDGECVRLLESLGYLIERLAADELLAKPAIES
jgi:FkbM family methyltransferase